MKRVFSKCLAAGAVIGLTFCLAACKTGDGMGDTDPLESAAIKGTAIESQPDMEQAQAPTKWYSFPEAGMALKLPEEVESPGGKEWNRNWIFIGVSDSMTVMLKRWDQVSLPDYEALAELVSKVTGRTARIEELGGLKLVMDEWPHGNVDIYLLGQDEDAYVLTIEPYVMKDPDVYWKVKAVWESICEATQMPKEAEVQTVSGFPRKEMDYLLLVNKDHAVPEGWEDELDLVVMVNSVGDEVWAERSVYKAYLELKDDLWKNDKVDVDLDSAYRSTAYQQDIMERFTEKYGAAYAAKTVAKPGYSEHQTGLAVDLYFRIDGEDVYYNEDLVKYPEVWKKIHARLADHGFILRYPGEENGNLGHEPWHIRFVGEEAAKEIMAVPELTFEDWLEKKGQSDAEK